jgi:hypothetical protein
MVEISKSGSGEGPGWATGRGYSTTQRYAAIMVFIREPWPVVKWSMQLS